MFLNTYSGCVDRLERKRRRYFHSTIKEKTSFFFVLCSFNRTFVGKTKTRYGGQTDFH